MPMLFNHSDSKTTAALKAASRLARTKITLCAFLQLHGVYETEQDDEDLLGENACIMCSSPTEDTMRPAAHRRPTNLRLDEAIVADARRLNVDLSRAAEDGIARAAKMERERLWQLENATAIAEMNDYIDRNGLPLGEYWQF